MQFIYGNKFAQTTIKRDSPLDIVKKPLLSQKSSDEIRKSESGIIKNKEEKTKKL